MPTLKERITINHQTVQLGLFLSIIQANNLVGLSVHTLPKECGHCECMCTHSHLQSIFVSFVGDRPEVSV